MKDYLKLWIQESSKLGSATLKSKLAVTGERNQHLGPRWEFAKIQVTIEPSSKFAVVDKSPVNIELQHLGYLDSAIFGLLDVLMVVKSAPLSNIRVVLNNVEHHPINSSSMAFRNAGRDAGLKIIEAFLRTSFK